MSHLLTRLVDRAMGVAPTIEPVRSPMFDNKPAEPGDVSEHGTIGFLYGDLVTGTRASPTAANERLAGHSDRVIGQAGRERTADSSVSPEARSTVAESPAAEEGIFSKRLLNAEPKNHDSIDTSVRALSPPGLNREIAADPEAMVAPAPATRVQAPLSLQAHPSTGDHAPEPVDALPAQPPDSHLQPRDVTDTQLRPTGFSDSSFSEQSVTDRFQQESNITRTVKPVIKITIGRIEVKAATTPPESAPQPRKKPRPSLSLDDYLEQRAGGQG